ncbi:MAG: hypothetical protein CMJ36_04500 [Phycisphaerae bacterium]|nr:hypothetical protein [Phycisphaerae bacterium]
MIGSILISGLLVLQGIRPAPEIEQGLLAAGTGFETTVHVTYGDEPGPTVMVIGGVHGNEPAGAEAAGAIACWTIGRGRLIVIPRANVPALDAKTRRIPGLEGDEGDLNRHFPIDPEIDFGSEYGAELWSFIEEREPDWIIDLHEGYDYRERNPDSVGNTIIACDEPEVLAASTLMLESVNATREEGSASFLQLRNPVRGSIVRAACARLDVLGMILETTKKNQPVSFRARQHRIMVHRLLQHLEMQPCDKDRILPHVDAADEFVHVALYDGPGANATAFATLLAGDARFRTRRIGPEAIRNGALDNADILIVPGGSGSRQGRGLGAGGREAIRTFVETGGEYIGACAGAYLGSVTYDWSLGIVDVEVIDRKHWKRGSGIVDVEWMKPGSDQPDLGDGTTGIRYANGPVFAPAHRDEIQDYEVLGVYRSEIALNGAPTGVMPGTPAVIMGSWGDGRAILLSPHLESVQSDPETRRNLLELLPWLAGISPPGSSPESDQ